MSKVKVMDFLESVGDWTVLEVADAVKGLEEKFGIKAAAMMVAAPAAVGHAPAAGAVAAEEKTDYAVVLTGAGDKKIQVIKVVRELTGLGLKEAKDLVEGAPKTVKENVPKAQAEEMKKKLVEVGAAVELK